VNSLLAFDANKDGKLAKSEVPERMQGIFVRGDANHDGFLTKDELTKLAATQNTAAENTGNDERGERTSERRDDHDERGEREAR
jgi:Ca2+-binding EF-hand superfamily protein